jgi:hypothetical protein
MREFERNANWTKETLLEVSKKTGLSEAQVYKWGWDQKRKTYGDQAVFMMPPFSSMGFGEDPAFASMEEQFGNQFKQEIEEAPKRKRGEF